MSDDSQKGINIFILLIIGLFVIVSLGMFILEKDPFYWSDPLNHSNVWIKNGSYYKTLNDTGINISELCLIGDDCITEFIGADNGTINLTKYYTKEEMDAKQTLYNLSPTCSEGQIPRYSMVFDMWYCDNDNDNQNLQEVTDIGATTDNTITMNGGNLNLNEGNILISNSGAGIQRTINYTNSNPNGIGSFGINNDVGAFITMAIVGSEVPIENQALNNDSGIVYNGGQGFSLVNANESYLIGHVPEGDGNFSNIQFTVEVKPNGNVILTGDLILNRSALVLDDQNDHFIRVNEGDVFDGIALNATHFGHNAMRDEGEITYLFTWENRTNLVLQAGRNNSVSSVGNSMFTIPNYWGEENFTEGGIINMTALTDYPFLCEYFGETFNVQCSFFADTRGRGLPLLATGDLEVWLSAVIHNGLLVKEDFNYIGNLGNDFDIFFNGGLENGKVHIEDKRQILANITFFDALIADFDGGTIAPFISESISPEPGRDWRTTTISPPECFDDQCAIANGGNDKVMAFSASTQFEGGTVASNNSRLLFYITTDFTGLGNCSVTIDNNEGNVSLLYDATVDTPLTLVNVSFPPEFENKTNVTSRFTLDSSGSTSSCWIDEVRVTSEPAEEILINESYNGGRIVLGEDRGNLSCAMEVEKYIPEGETSTQWRLNLGSSDCITNIVGNVTFTDSTVINQTVIGDLTVTGTISQNGSTLDDTYVNVNGDTMTGNLNMDGNQINNVSVLDNGGTEITVNDDINVKDNSFKTEKDGVIYDITQITQSIEGFPSLESLKFDSTFGTNLFDFRKGISFVGDLFSVGTTPDNGNYIRQGDATAGLRFYTSSVLKSTFKWDDGNSFLSMDTPVNVDTTLTLSSGSIVDSTGLLDIGNNVEVQGSLKVNSADEAGVGLILGGYNLGGASMGGFIELEKDGVSGTTGWMYANSNNQLVFDSSAQSSSGDEGNAWIDFDDGSASFSNVTATGTGTLNDIDVGNEQIIIDPGFDSALGVGWEDSSTGTSSVSISGGQLTMTVVNGVEKSKATQVMPLTPTAGKRYTVEIDVDSQNMDTNIDFLFGSTIQIEISIPPGTTGIISKSFISGGGPTELTLTSQGVFKSGTAVLNSITVHEIVDEISALGSTVNYGTMDVKGMFTTGGVASEYVDIDTAVVPIGDMVSPLKIVQNTGALVSGPPQTTPDLYIRMADGADNTGPGIGINGGGWDTVLGDGGDSLAFGGNGGPGGSYSDIAGNGGAPNGAGTGGAGGGFLRRLGGGNGAGLNGTFDVQDNFSNSLFKIYFDQITSSVYLNISETINTNSNFSVNGVEGFTGSCINTTYSGGMAVSCND